MGRKIKSRKPLVKSWYLEDEISGVDQPKKEDIQKACELLNLPFNKETAMSIIYGDRFIKGETYLIDNHPHFYQGTEDRIYRFLKWDGSIKYVNEDSLEKVKSNKCSEQLNEAKEKANYYMQKYLWFKNREENNELQEQYSQKKKSGWFADNKYVQNVAFFSMGASAVASIFIVSKSPSFWISGVTFIILMICGVISSLIVSWLTYKLFD